MNSPDLNPWNHILLLPLQGLKVKPSWETIRKEKPSIDIS